MTPLCRTGVSVAAVLASVTALPTALARISGNTPPFSSPLTALEVVPGISFVSLKPTPGRLPTAAQCAAAWNTSAPVSVRRWVAFHHPIGGHIAMGRITNNPPDPPTTPRKGFITWAGPVCWVEMYFGHGKLFQAVGAWTDGKVNLWSGGAGTLPRWATELVLRHLRAAVHSDGTIHPWARH
jgi:hypothetical protein